MRSRLSLVMTGVTLLYLGNCVAQTPEADLPPGVSYLQHAKGGKGFEVFIEEALRESELFRRRILQGQDRDLIDTKLLAGALAQFCRQAPAYLEGRKDIAGFELSEADVRKALEGKEIPPAQQVFGGFTGKWYGKWDQMQVDHHWGKIVEYEQPRRIEIAGHRPVYLRSWQYCWVGDGYGLNGIATDDIESKARDYLLAYVTHVREGDMSQPTNRRPHVGICVSPSKLIWITVGEIFLEECHRTGTGVDAYAITGFFYKVKNKILETSGCFQSHYTRDCNVRPAWFSFTLKLKVDASGNPH